ncbi:cell division protein FtsH, partial [Deinococcus sonorensis]
MRLASALLTCSLLGLTGLTVQAQASPQPLAVMSQSAASSTAGVTLAAAGRGYTASNFFADVRAGRVTSVTLQGDGSTSVMLQDGQPHYVVLPPDAQTLETLRKAGVPFSVLDGSSPFGWVTAVLPLILAVLILLVMWRSVRGGQPGGGASQFGRSKATVHAEGQVKVTFAEVAGCDEAKQDLAEVVDFL